MGSAASLHKARTKRRARDKAVAALVAGIKAMPQPSTTFSVTNILGKQPGESKLEDEYLVDKQIGKGAFGVVRLVRGAARAQLHAVHGSGHMEAGTFHAASACTMRLCCMSKAACCRHMAAHGQLPTLHPVAGAQPRHASIDRSICRNTHATDA